MGKKDLIYIGIILVLVTASFFAGCKYTLERNRLDTDRIEQDKRILTEQKIRIDTLSRGLLESTTEVGKLRTEANGLRTEVIRLAEQLAEYNGRVTAVEEGLHEDIGRIDSVIDRLRFYKDQAEKD